MTKWAQAGTPLIFNTYKSNITPEKDQGMVAAFSFTF